MLGKAVYFPEPQAGPGVLAGGLSAFDQITLYTLPHETPGGLCLAAAKRGLVRARPIEFITRKEEIDGLLTDFESWSAQMGAGGVLAALKSLAATGERQEMPSRLSARIRAPHGQDEAKNPNRQAQVVMHFLASLGRKEEETRRLMAEADRQNQLTAELMGVDQAEYTAPPLPQQPLTQAHPALANPACLAWARCHQALGSGDSVFLTDSQAVISLMERNLGRGAGPEIFPGQEPLPCLFHLDFEGPGLFVIEEIEKSRARLEPLTNDLARACAPLLAKGLGRAETSELSGELKQIIMRHQAISEPDAPPAMRLSAFLLPGRDASAGLMAALGLGRVLSPGDRFTGLVFLLEQPGSMAR